MYALRFRGSVVTDKETWEKAVAAVAGEYAALASAVRMWTEERTSAIREAKKALNAISQEVGGGEICAVCRGECCARGRHHVTVTDLLVHLAARRPLPVPDFSVDHCPWLGTAGCFMDPTCRPFNCVTFNCERVEGLLEPPVREHFYRVERDLRALYGEVEDFFGNRFMHGLLLSYERAVAGDGVLLRVGKP